MAVFTRGIAATDDLQIPVVDMNDFYSEEKREAFLDTLFDAMATVGFFAVRNTGVDRGVIESAYGQAERFFKSDLEYKLGSFAKATNGQRGFVPGERAKGYKAKDAKEFFHIGRELSSEEHRAFQICPNVWPDQAGFKEDLLALYQELDQYVIPLQESIIAAINHHTHSNLPLSFLNDTTQHGDILLRALYYPALNGQLGAISVLQGRVKRAISLSAARNLPPDTGAEKLLPSRKEFFNQEQIDALDGPLFWAAEHTDIDYLAILPYATEKGLQVEVDGKWYYVVVPEDAFIVNVGDMLENMTNGLLKSARHRVLAQEPNKERFSMVLFVHPTDDTSLSPLPSCIAKTGGIQLYAPGTRKEFLWERLLELNVAPALLEPYSLTGHTERQMQFGRESPQVVEMLLEHNLASPTLRDLLKNH